MQKPTAQRLAAISVVVLALACAALWRAKSASHPDAPASADGPGPSAAVEPSAPSAGRPPTPTPAPVPGPLTPAQLGELDEARLMARLRTAAGSDPTLAVQLAREGNRRFPDSRDAPERASILIHALAGLERSMEARGEAEEMVNHYPDSEWVREIERFTGAHRHRNVRINDAGVLEYY